MRAFPRPDRIVFRLGNVLPDVSGEIDPARVRRAQTETGIGEPRARRLAAGTERAGIPIVRE